jgi:serine/threonine-protein kinase HipA
VAKRLDVFLYAKKAGQLVQKDDGRLSFSYAPDYLRAEGAAALSLALPLAETAYEHGVCHAVFGGMLPEGEVRRHLARALGVSERNDFSLLAEIGGECAGAVSMWLVGGPGPKPGVGTRRVLTDQDLEELFRKLPTRPLLTTAGVRLSLAGAQNKLALVLDQGQLILPAEDEPSTHIFKIAPDRFDGILENELFCLRLAQSSGLPSSQVTLGRAGAVDYLCVERFDRKRVDGKVTRLHQEDFCQALGIAPEIKYQNDGGPNLLAGVNLLRKHSARPAADISAFLRLTYFNYLVGNADAHAKNYSLLLTDDGPVFAPAYDILCTAAYPALSLKMAMKVGKEYDPDRLVTRHWEDLATQCDLKPAYVIEGLRELAVRVGKEAPLVATALAAEIGSSDVLKPFLKVIGERVQRAQTF